MIPSSLVNGLGSPRGTVPSIGFVGRDKFTADDRCPKRHLSRQKRGSDNFSEFWRKRRSVTSEHG